MKIPALQVRPGNVLDHNGRLWSVMKIDIIQPGKGASVVQVEMRDVDSGNKTNERFRTQETVERVHVDEIDFQYLYEDGTSYTFMNTETFDQIEMSADVIGDGSIWLQEGMVVQVESFEGRPLSVSLPQQAVVEVIECEPVVKGQTASSSYKPSTVDNGARVMVPPHIEVGTRIVVRTADGTYVERAKS